MRISGSVEGDIAAALAEEQDSLAQQLRAGMQAAADKVQGDLRGQTQAAGLGTGLVKAWQLQTFPRGGSGKTLSPAALVYSKSTILHRVFSEGAEILPKRAKYLAIPTREAEALGFATTNITRSGSGTGSIPRRSSMVRDAIASLGEKNVRFAPAKKGRVLVIYRAPQGRGAGQRLGRRGRGVTVRRGADVPLFILVPQVRLRARIDFAGAQTRAQATLAAEIGLALN